MARHEPEVERAIEKVRGHKWVCLGPPIAPEHPKGLWLCECCGAKAKPPLALSEHYGKKCPARASK